MHEAMLYDKLPGAYVRCHTCQWRCRIAPDKTGVCRRYKNQGGTLYSLNYALVSSVAVDPVEKKPLYHFHPGTQYFSLGSWGCNFHCPGCQNWSIACTAGGELVTDNRNLSPEGSVKLARDNKCHGIAWTYNEPTMWLEYSREAARIAVGEGLYTAYVTNDYLTPEALDAIGPYLQAWRVDVKGFGIETYKKISKITRWQSILELAALAKSQWNMHVEVVTNIIPAINDDSDQLKSIADWIAAELGELTPWHVTRFYPRHKLLDIPVTPMETLERARDLGYQAGLRFIYFGNVETNTDTWCYNCHKLVVRRSGPCVDILGLDGSKCKFCGTNLNFRTST